MKDQHKDGRSARWDDHRASRREQLVLAAVQAIDEHGAGAGIAEIAAAAGVSKPVLYRYFADKDDLYRAVGNWGADQVLSKLTAVLRSDRTPREMVDVGAREYFKLIAEHPQVFLLLVEHRTADPLRDGRDRIATTMTRALVDGLRAIGADASGAEPWAHGMVGLGLAQGEWWLRRRTVSRKAAAGFLADFIWHAFSGIAAASGSPLETPRPLPVPKARG